MNFERRVLNKLLDEVLAGKWDNSILLVENKDRLVRFSAALCEKIFKSKGIEAIYFAQEEITDDETLTNDILSVIHYFSAKSYSKRANERRKKVISSEATTRAKQLIDSGMNLREIVTVLDKEKLRAEDGSPVLYNLLRKTVYHKQEIIETVVGKTMNSGEEWKAQFTSRASSSYCLAVADAYEEYLSWVSSAHKLPLSKLKFAKLFGPSELIYNAPAKRMVSAWKGLVVKGKALHFIYEAKQKTDGPMDVLLDFTNQVQKGEALNQVFKRYKSFCKDKNIAALSKLQVSEAVKTLVG